jgi:hypothetical protein
VTPFFLTADGRRLWSEGQSPRPGQAMLTLPLRQELSIGSPCLYSSHYTEGSLLFCLAVFFKLAIEGFAINAENVSNFFFVSSAQFHRYQDVLAFEVC